MKVSNFMRKLLIFISIVLVIFSTLTLFSQNKPFPQATAYPGCIKPNHISQTQMNADIASFYDTWKKDNVFPATLAKPYGYYVEMEGTGATNEKSTSEAHGYGMLIFALMAGQDPEARTYFDGMFYLYKQHPSTEDPDCMSWKIDKTEDPAKDDSSATDGDMDIAYALILAHEQWGSADPDRNYLAEARRIINNGLKQSCMSPTTKRVMLGDFGEWYHGAGQYNTRTSDWMTAHLRAYQKVTSDNFWLTAIDTAYDIADYVAATYAPTTGLLPDFVVSETPEPAPADFLESKYDGDYYWNACRVPLRISTDYAHHGEGRAKQVVARILNWITGVASSPTSIAAGYTLEGQIINTYTSHAFTAPIVAACITDAQRQSYLNAGWDVIKYPEHTYFGDTISLMSMLLISGNWWRPADTILPVETPTPPSTPQPGQNMLKNGDFSQGTTGWIFKKEGAGNGSMSVVNGELKVDIISGGADVWSVQVDQTGLYMETGIDYEISFTARADAPRTMKVIVGMSGDPWHLYSQELICNLTVSDQPYTMKYKMIMFSDMNAQVEFDMGGNTNNIYLDDVVLRATSVLVTPTPTPQCTPAPFSFSGKLTDSQSGQVIAGANIRYEFFESMNYLGAKDVVTDANGNYSFVHYMCGLNLTANIKVVKDGYEDLMIYRKTVTPTTIFDMQMEAAASPYENIAVGKKMVASSSYNTDFGITNINDGNENTIWASKLNPTAAEWFFIDLGKVEDINGLIIKWFDVYHATKYSIGLSDDAKTWNLVLTTQSNGGIDELVTPNSFKTRYVGILCSVPNRKLAYAVSEFEVVKEVVPVQNMLLNGDFSSLGMNWNASVDAAANATFDFSTKQAKVSITNGGTEEWHVYLGQERLNIEQGASYTVTFKAQSNINRTIQALVCMSAAPYDAYSNIEIFNLTSTMSEYSFTFTMTKTTDPLAGFEFDLGKAAGDIVIDDVVLVKN